ncbi:MAG: glycosyltransferase, partial [Parvularculaceae bacterium]|nr:glycosyltransferase [Parvularculaceae bacterium]
MLLTAFSAIILIIWMVLAGTRLPPFSPPPRLGVEAAPARRPGVVAVTPARNEEETIGAAIAAHAASDYPGAFSVVLVDDHSSDETVARARAAGGERLTICAAPPLPAGWSGKL